MITCNVLCLLYYEFPFDCAFTYSSEQQFESKRRLAYQQQVVEVVFAKQRRRSSTERYLIVGFEDELF